METFVGANSPGGAEVLGHSKGIDINNLQEAARRESIGRFDDFTDDFAELG